MAFIYAIYLDALIMENILLDGVSLLCVGLWCKKPLRLKGLGWGVAFGVGAGTVCFLTVRNFLLYLAALFFLVNPLMLLIAFGRMSVASLAKLYGCCMSLNLVLGGCINWLRQMIPGKWYQWILPISCASAVIIILLLGWGKRHEATYVKVTVLVQGQVREMCALRDTGNCLRDVLTGRPVCIVSREWQEELGLSEENLRPISYETVAGKDTLYIYPANKFFVMEKGEMRQQRDMMLGFGKKSLFQGKKYQMILHKEFC